MEFVDYALPNIAWFRLAHAMRITTEFANIWEDIMSNPKTAGHFEANTEITVGLGKAATSVEANSADKLRTYLLKYVKDLFVGENNTKLDVLAMPTLPMLARKIPSNAFETGESNVVVTVEMMKYIFLANFIGLPAITIPIGYLPVNAVNVNKEKDENNMSKLAATKNDQPEPEINMPVGLQFVGNHWTENKLLTLASELEEALL